MDPIERWIAANPFRFVAGYMTSAVVGGFAVLLSVSRDSSSLRDSYRLALVLLGALLVVAIATVVSCRVRTSRAVPGWYKDVRGVHRLRYWSGTAWTEWVADGGQGFREVWQA